MTSAGHWVAPRYANAHAFWRRKTGRHRPFAAGGPWCGLRKRVAFPPVITLCRRADSSAVSASWGPHRTPNSIADERRTLTLFCGFACGAGKGFMPFELAPAV
jgi:hypothetical protein